MAIDPANRSPSDPRTLIRAARDFAVERPQFALAAGMAALRGIANGWGYDITGIDVLDAYAAVLQAAGAAGMDVAVVNADVLALITANRGGGESLSREYWHGSWPLEFLRCDCRKKLSTCAKSGDGYANSNPTATSSFQTYQNDLGHLLNFETGHVQMAGRSCHSLTPSAPCFSMGIYLDIGEAIEVSRSTTHSFHARGGHLPRTRRLRRYVPMGMEESPFIQTI